jgi:hypothetical protein
VNYASFEFFEVFRNPSLLLNLNHHYFFSFNAVKAQNCSFHRPISSKILEILHFQYKPGTEISSIKWTRQMVFVSLDGRNRATFHNIMCSYGELE